MSGRLRISSSRSRTQSIDSPRRSQDTQRITDSRRSQRRGTSNAATASQTSVPYYAECTGPDDDEHTAMENGMRLGQQDLTNTIQNTHNLMQERRSDAPAQAAAAVTAHILDTPPSSPASILTMPVSGTDAEKEFLEKQSLAELVKIDAEMHAHQGSFEDLRTWWAANREEWKAMKNRLSDHRDELERLNSQKYTTVIDQELRAERARRDVTLRWFNQNRIVMKGMWEKFKAVQEKARQRLDPEWKPLIWDEKEREEFVYSYKGYEGPRRLVFNYEEPSEAEKWLQSTDCVEWYYEEAGNDFREHAKHLEGHLAVMQTELDKVIRFKNTLQDEVRQSRLLDTDAGDRRVDAEIRRLRADKSYSYKQQVAEILEKRRLERVEMIEGSIPTSLAGYNIKQGELEATLYMLNEQSAIVSLILQILDLQVTELGIHGLDKAQGRNRNVFHAMHRLFYVYAQRRRISHYVRSILNDDTVGKVKKSKILNRVEENTERWEIILPPRNQNGRYRQREIQQWADAHSKRNEDLYAQEKDIAAFYIEPLPLNIRDYRLRPVNIHALFARPKTTADIIPQRLGWGTNMTLMNAFNIMQMPVPSSNGESWSTLLYGFFLSPDIFRCFHPDWRTKSGWTRDTWKTAVNDKLRNRFDEGVLEAWLVFCNHTDVMFRTDFFSGRVYPISAGRETVGEDPKTALPERRIRDGSVEPPFENMAEIEGVLLQHKSELVEGKERETGMAYLVILLNTAFGADTFTVEDVQKMGTYWSTLGRFYTSSPDRTRNQLFRIDNGWDLPEESLPDLRYKHRYTESILATVMSNPPPSSLITIAEGNMYAYADEADLYKFWFREGEWEITRHKWRLFLRYATCSSRIAVFRLRRDGKVEVDRHQWGAQGRGN